MNNRRKCIYVAHKNAYLTRGKVNHDTGCVAVKLSSDGSISVYKSYAKLPMFFKRMFGTTAVCNITAAPYVDACHLRKFIPMIGNCNGITVEGIEDVTRFRIAHILESENPQSEDYIEVLHDSIRAILESVGLKVVDSAIVFSGKDRISQGSTFDDGIVTEMVYPKKDRFGFDVTEYLGTIKLLPQSRQWRHPKTASHIKLNN